MSRALAARHPAAFPESLLNKFLLIARGKEQVVVGWRKKKKKRGKKDGEIPLCSATPSSTFWLRGVPGSPSALQPDGILLLGRVLCVCAVFEIETRRCSECGEG